MIKAQKALAFDTKAVEELPIAVYLKDSHHRFVYLNKAAARMLNLPVGEKDTALGKKDKDFFTPELARAWQQQEQQLLHPGTRETPVIDQYEEQRGRGKGRGKSGRVFTSKMVLTIEGEKYILGFSKPVLRHENIEKTSLAIRGSQAGLWYVNYSTGEVWHSKRWKEILGYQDDELDGRDLFRKLLHPQDAPKVTAACNSYFASAGPGKYYHCVFRMRCKNGEWKWIESTGQARFSVQDKKVVEFAGSHVDVTDRIERTHLHEAILDAVPALIYLKNDKKQFVYLNAALAKVFGRSASEILDSKLRDRDLSIHLDEVHHFESDDQTIISKSRDKIKVPLELLTPTKKGERPMLLKTARMALGYPSRSPRRHVLGISTDITDSIQTLVHSLESMPACLSEMEGARSEDAVCLIAIKHLRKLAPKASCMISFKQRHRNRPAIIGRPDLATGVFAEIASQTQRYCDLEDDKLDILPWVLKHRKTSRLELILNSQTDPRCDRTLCKKLGIKTQFIVPLFAKDQEFGTLQVAFKDVAALTPDLVASVKIIATSLSLGIEAYRNRSALNAVNAALQEKNAKLLYATAIPVIVHSMYSKIISLGESYKTLMQDCERIMSSQPENQRRSPETILEPLVDLKRHIDLITGDFSALGESGIKAARFNVVSTIDAALRRCSGMFETAGIQWSLTPEDPREAAKLMIRGVRMAFLSIILDCLENTLRTFQHFSGSEKRLEVKCSKVRVKGRSFVQVDLMDNSPGIPAERAATLFDISSDGPRHELARARDLLRQEPFNGDIQLVSQASSKSRGYKAHFRITIAADG